MTLAPIPFTTEEERIQIIAEMKKKGLFLIEEQKHYNGDFLVFDSQPLSIKPAVTLESLAERVKILENKVLSVEKT